MVGMRFIVHSGILGDIEWLRSIGFDEAGLVIATMDTIPSSTFIHQGGIETATLDCLGAGIFGVGAAGGQFAGHFQAIKTSGWDMISGTDVGGEVVRTIMNNVNYCNYGIMGYDVYSSPYNHPIAGPNTYHVDYISTFDQEAWWLSCLNAQAMAVRTGTCAEVGIAISLQTFSKFDLETWVSVIEATRTMGVPCNNICFWGDVTTDGSTVLKTDAYEILTGLITHYGIRHGIGSE